LDKEEKFVATGIQLTILGVWIALGNNDGTSVAVAAPLIIGGTYLVGRIVAKPVWRSLRS